MPSSGKWAWKESWKWTDYWHKASPHRSLDQPSYTESRTYIGGDLEACAVRTRETSAAKRLYNEPVVNQREWLGISTGLVATRAPSFPHSLFFTKNSRWVSFRGRRNRRRPYVLRRRKTIHLTYSSTKCYDTRERLILALLNNSKEYGYLGHKFSGGFPTQDRDPINLTINKRSFVISMIHRCFLDVRRGSCVWNCRISWNKTFSWSKTRTCFYIPTSRRIYDFWVESIILLKGKKVKIPA